MTVREVVSEEYVCDGHCGAKADEKRISAPAGSYKKLPDGWIKIEGKLSPTGADLHHLCPTCVSVVALALWNKEAQFDLINTRPAATIEDYGLSERCTTLAKLNKR